MTTALPDYAVFDDYRYHQRIAVMVRWFVALSWVFLINYRASADSTLVILNCMGVALLALNGFVHWRIWQGHPITRHWVLALSVMDLSVITTGVAVTTRFGNTFFVIYYPALLGVSLAFSSRRLAFLVVTATAAAYAAISVTMDPGINLALREDKALIVRILSMYGVVAAGNLMNRIERQKRREAVEAERALARRNLELQKKAQDAELAALAERVRIAREIHDGIAQSIYMLSLNLETCADLADKQEGPLRDHLRGLVPLAKQTLLETRQYIFDLKPLLAGEKGLAAMVENQVREFRTVSGVKVDLSIQGDPRPLPVATATGLYRILQEALANVLKHAKAPRAQVTLVCAQGEVRMTVQDDGAGFDEGRITHGYGLENMPQRAQELGGRCEVSSIPGQGARVAVTLPVEGGAS